MIPFIRSQSELMAITESRDFQKEIHENNEFTTSTVDSGQRKRYIRSINKKEVKLPNLPKIIRRKWTNNRNNITRFIKDLDYNNQILSTYDLTLLERQNKRNHKDIA